MQHLNSNASLITIGLQEYRRGSDIAEGGIVQIAEGILQSWDTVLRWSYKGEGGKEVYGLCKLGELYKPILKPDGEVDGKAKSAKWRAVGELYNPDGGDMEARDKVALQRGFTIAAACKAGAEVEFETVTVERGGKRRKVRAAIVPAEVAFDFVDSEGKTTPFGRGAIKRHKEALKALRMAVPESESEVLEKLAGMPVECVGGNHPTFGKVPSASSLANILRPYAVAAGFMPPAKPRNTDSKVEDTGREALESLDFLTSSLDVMLTSDEADFAPSAEFDAKLQTLIAKAQAYLARFAD
jgi:hypothetical protein